MQLIITEVVKIVHVVSQRNLLKYDNFTDVYVVKNKRDSSEMASKGCKA